MTGRASRAGEIGSSSYLERNVSETEVGHVSPDISIIVVFHSRLEFLTSALDSALHQTIPLDKFEIVVVGPERPPVWSDRGAGPSTKFVKCDEVGLGAKVAEGVRVSRGSIVTFLEDDDLYAPERLSYIAGAFQSDPSLTYLQNGFRVIDARGRPRPSHDLHARIMRSWLARGAVCIPGSPTPSQLRAIREIPSGFNTSSIAVRREVLADHLDLVRDVDMLVDVTLLYLSFLHPGHLRFDPAPLTSFRKHAASDSNPQQLEDSSEFLSRMRKYQQRGQQSRLYLVRYVLAHGTPSLSRAIEGQQAIAKVILHLRSPDAARSERGQSILEALARWPTFEVIRYWTAFPLGILCFLTPNLGSRVYSSLRRMREGYG
jgi:glycosyltransferase involved in cell wall biosynthesis